ncbi:lysozyme inhibitor LprI family protein [Nostoc sp. CALU 1950]|uniref:lysozyme inhibitor LprI family protein n=1 Tax=Nostoc sp. CALU 1950 TaxID=3104321 RepID=UPI003EBF4A15
MLKRMVVAVLLFSSVAQAAPVNKVDYQQMYSKCLKAVGVTNNSSVDQCSRQTFKASEQEINRLYGKIYHQIASRQAEDAKKFELSQKFWLSYRDSHCKLAGAYVGSPMYSYCPMQLNISRVAELREFAGEWLLRESQI